MPDSSQLKSQKVITTIFSVCTKEHLDVWQSASTLIVKNIKSEQYMVVVPDSDVDAFTDVSAAPFLVLGESSIIGDLKLRLSDKMSINMQDRLGWYLQQFIKLSLVQSASENDVVLIWDADTVPLETANVY